MLFSGGTVAYFLFLSAQLFFLTQHDAKAVRKSNDHHHHSRAYVTITSTVQPSEIKDCPGQYCKWGCQDDDGIERAKKNEKFRFTVDNVCHSCKCINKNKNGNRDVSSCRQTACGNQLYNCQNVTKVPDSCCDECADKVSNVNFEFPPFEFPPIPSGAPGKGGFGGKARFGGNGGFVGVSAGFGRDFASKDGPANVVGEKKYFPGPPGANDVD